MKKILFMAVLLFFCAAVQASAVEFSADINSSVMGMTTTSKIYFKDVDTQRMEMMGMVIITSGTDSYELFEDTKQYVVVTEEELEENSPMADVDDFDEFFKENDFQKTGKESVSGYKCEVYEGSVQYDESQPAMAMKLWYSTKLEYPVKTEAQLPAPMSGSTVSTLENIKIEKQPASLFEIPAGYTQAGNTMDAMGMGGFSMPSGSDESEDEFGGMPSQEDLGKMMQMMQEMMGGQEE